MKGTVSVIGAGTMGRGIAEVSGLAGYSVILVDSDEKLARLGMERLISNLNREIEKGRISKDSGDGAISRIKPAWDIDSINGSFLVIEAVPEDIKLKQKVLAEAEAAARADAIIATNTSSISINALASALHKKSRFLGLHFFNPVPLMKLVEIVRGMQTSDDVISSAKAFVLDIGKTSVAVKDSPGFVSNRILMLFINEAIKTLEDGIASKEDIDTVARLGFNHPMGPLELADLIGLDVCMDIMNVIYLQKKDDKFKPADMLVSLVNSGKSGRKSGEGFYSYKK
jgi:3-hydroxybutyryl-CoA dehydrogenase